MIAASADQAARSLCELPTLQLASSYICLLKQLQLQAKWLLMHQYGQISYSRAICGKETTAVQLSRQCLSTLLWQ